MKILSFKKKIIIKIALVLRNRPNFPDTKYSVKEHECLFCSHFSQMCFQLLAHTVSSEINIRSLNSEGSAFKETLLITEKPDHWEPDCRTSLRPANE